MSTAQVFSTDEILWYDNGKWGEAGYALANPNGKTWTNNSMLKNQDPIWAVAVEVTIRFDGDARAGLPVRGHVFPCPRSAPDAADLQSDSPAVAEDSAQIGLTAESFERDHFHGFGQSPQRSR